MSLSGNPKSPDLHPKKRLASKVALGSALWLIFVGGCGALWNAAAIRDDRIRADLEAHGSRVAGLLSSEDRLTGTPHWHGCGKGLHAVLQFVPEGQSRRRKCIGDSLPSEYRHYIGSTSLPDARVTVIYDPAKSSHFFVAAPDGSMLRRELRGIWRRWLIQTAVLFGLYALVIGIALWRDQRR